MVFLKNWQWQFIGYSGPGQVLENLQMYSLSGYLVILLAANHFKSNSISFLQDPGTNIYPPRIINMGLAVSETVVLTAGLFSVVLASLTTMFLVSIEIPDSIKVKKYMT